MDTLDGATYYSLICFLPVALMHFSYCCLKKHTNNLILTLIDLKMGHLLLFGIHLQ